MHASVHINTCVSVSVCVIEKERKREREREIALTHVIQQNMFKITNQ